MHRADELCNPNNRTQRLTRTAPDRLRIALWNQAMKPSDQNSEGQSDSTPGISSPAVGAAVEFKPRPAPPRHLPPYRVLLHNDDVNEVQQVIAWLTELTPLAHARAVEVTLEADVRGVSLVIVTHRELAELYRDQLRTRRLTVTIEHQD